MNSFILPQYRFVTKHEIAELTGFSEETLKRYRLSGKLIEGVHWIRVNPRVVRYNATLVMDWIQNLHAPQSHQQAIAHYLSTLPSNQPKKRGRSAHNNFPA
ncbi:excisionase family protein [Leptolyngbya sp. ST-U4]|uniref:helix-turn-helix transcriptional regulator n=1 Tax=Leptolyngbya sp. ST-U4 TaxID=2933912 RepID=UPI003296A12C